MRNLKRLQDTLTLLESLPDDRFNYGSYLNNVGYDAIRDRKHHCGTVGCVAGWVVAHNLLELHRGGIDRTAGQWLGLSHSDSYFLFIAFIDRGTKEDAIRRLKHLIAGGSFEDYDWTQESDYQHAYTEDLKYWLSVKGSNQESAEENAKNYADALVERTIRDCKFRLDW